VSHIDRGYPDFVEIMRSLGGEIVRVSADSTQD
jgi:UDP-N-acetylglucosamine 1-carboxyvinyltransferase